MNLDSIDSIMSCTTFGEGYMQIRSGVMPNGQTFRAQIESTDMSKPQLIELWTATVRRAYEGQQEQAVEKSRKEKALRVANERADTDAKDGGGGDTAVAQAVPDVETDIATIIASKLRSARKRHGEYYAMVEQYETLCAEMQTEMDKLQKLEEALYE